MRSKTSALGVFNLEELKSSDYFKEKTLLRWEVLFDEWEIDNNLYFIDSWKLSIEKYTTKEKETSKQLAVIKTWDFLWEGSLNNSIPKQVKIISLETTKILYIDAKNDFLEFMKINPELAKNILVWIIDITNKRTLSSNKYIASLYEINQSINKIEEINYLEIFKILEKIKTILNWEYILYLEVNPIDEKYLTLKYNSRKPMKMQDLLVQKWHYKLDEIWINKADRILTKEIKIATEHLWNIIVWKKENFSENEKRIFIGLVTSLSGMLKQKKILEEERNIEFSKI